MIINLSEIMSVKSKTKRMEVDIEMENFNREGEEFPIVSKEPVLLELIHEKDREVLIKGSTKVELLIPCSRCLDEVTIPFEITFSKDLDFKVTDTDKIKDLDETNYIDGYNLDVDLLIYDEILINFPIQVLCSPSCKGICKVCGKNLNKETCDCEQSVGDPRMSVIQDIFKNFKEV
ncbi:MAG: DUF177 domain-containing protein [Lachnospiraceae bacterium]|nr:DUF177 domain-containing protein [Lachnospiraceae bacterium]